MGELAGGGAGWGGEVVNNNNNNNSNSAIPRKNLQARGAVHYQHQNPLDNQKSTSIINAYINIKMTKKVRMKKKKKKKKKKQEEEAKKKKKKKKQEEEAKYHKCVHRY